MDKSPLKKYPVNFKEINGYLRRAKKKKIKFYGIFDAEVKSQPPADLKHFGPAHKKFLPPKYSSQSAMIIFGDYVVTYSDSKLKKMGEDMTIFVLRDKNLAESYKKWFWFMYENV